jgi:hypothetical protein
MYLAVMVRHDEQLGLMNNDDARLVDMVRIQTIRQDIKRYIYEIYQRSLKLNVYLKTRPTGVSCFRH